MNYNAVVIGGSNIDVCAKSFNKLVEKDSNIGKIEFALGGVGRNIAEDLSLLGVNTSLLTAIANDSFGHVVMDNAREQDISLLEEPFQETGYKTGVFAYISDSNGDFVLGVNDMDITQLITPEVINKNINALDFSDYVVIEANLPVETIEEVAKHNYQLIADCVSTTKCMRLAGILDKLFLLKANYIEAVKLTGETDNLKIIEKLVSMGLKRAIITLGGNGAMCYEKLKDGIHWYKLCNMPGQVVADTSGCGDAMLSGFLFDIMREKPFSECLYAGQSAASLKADSLSSVNRNLSFMKLKETITKFKEKAQIEEGIIK